MIENLESSLQNNTSEAEDCIKQEINILKNKKTLIMKNPSILGKFTSIDMLTHTSKYFNGANSVFTFSVRVFNKEVDP